MIGKIIYNFFLFLHVTCEYSNAFFIDFVSFMKILLLYRAMRVTALHKKNSFIL